MFREYLLGGRWTNLQPDCRHWKHWNRPWEIGPGHELVVGRLAPFAGAGRWRYAVDVRRADGEWTVVGLAEREVLEGAPPVLPGESLVAEIPPPGRLHLRVLGVRRSGYRSRIVPELPYYAVEVEFENQTGEDLTTKWSMTWWCEQGGRWHRHESLGCGNTPETRLPQDGVRHDRLLGRGTGRFRAAVTFRSAEYGGSHYAVSDVIEFLPE